MKKIILNVTGQLSRNNPFRKEMVNPNKSISEQLEQLWLTFLTEEVGSMEESLSLNGIATCVHEANTVYTHLYIPLMSNVKLGKIRQLLGCDGLIQHDPI